MKMILHQDITIHFDPIGLCAFTEIVQKLPSISIIPENFFPSISARHDVVDGTGKLNPRSDPPDFQLCAGTKTSEAKDAIPSGLNQGL